MQDFLLELGFEELPARFIENAVRQLSESVTKKLAEQRLQHGEVLHFSTPRRLTLLIKDLQLEQEDLVAEIKGPPLNIARDQDGNLTKAGQGFLRSQGLDESAAVIKSFQGADYLYVVKEVTGQKTATLLKPLLEDTISHLSFPKNMRWGDYENRYARPLRWIVSLLGTELIPLTIGPVKSDRTTFGHRQLSAGSIVIDTPKAYNDTLQEHYVMANSGQRRQMIWEQVQAVAKQEGAQVQLDERLLDEVTNLVEYPTVFGAHFPAEYLDVPAEVLITSMKEHQRYFPLHDATGQLLPKFIGVRNGADNHLDIVIRGNEKVLEARLADAKFFYDEDLKTNLADNLSKLDRVVFQENLGSMGDKVRRIEALATQLLEKLGHADHKQTVLRTARLAKCDLVSQVVNEFPELQGIVGEKYSLAQGEKAVVATGVREHYLPRFSGDVLPTTVEGVVVSLADKLDTLVGYFALGKIPTGSQDPFALRRQAQGIVQILLNQEYSVSLAALMDVAAQGYGDLRLDEEHAQALLDFFLARLRVLLLDRGYAYDVVDAAMASGDDRIPSIFKRIKALTAFRNSERYDDLMIGFERVVNLAAKGKGEKLATEAFAPADQHFHQALQELDHSCQKLLADEDYQKILENLGAFRSEVDSFFTEVMIMDSDPLVRSNRLALLKKALKLYTLCGALDSIVANK